MEIQGLKIIYGNSKIMRLSGVVYAKIFIESAGKDTKNISFAPTAGLTPFKPSALEGWEE